jgi:hypothetical protein
LTLIYTPGPTADNEDGAIVVRQRPAAPEAVDLVRFGFLDVDTATVRGHRAVIGHVEAHGVATLVQWYEPSGLLVSVWAEGLSESEALQFAEDLRPADGTEVEQLRRAYAEPNIYGVSTDTAWDAFISGS